jgi:hypothetical protein
MKPKHDKLTQDELEEELEEGLEESFPGSDAPAATQPVHHQQRTPEKKP